MANKILDHIESRILEGSRRPNPHGISFDIRAVADAIPSMTADDSQYRMRGELRVFFEQFVTHGNSEEHRRAKERAKASIARHLYGDLFGQLLELQELLWVDGVRDGEHTKKLSQILHELSGQMNRFE